MDATATITSGPSAGSESFTFSFEFDPTDKPGSCPVGIPVTSRGNRNGTRTILGEGIGGVTRPFLKLEIPSSLGAGTVEISYHLRPAESAIAPTKIQFWRIKKRSGRRYEIRATCTNNAPRGGQMLFFSAKATRNKKSVIRWSPVECRQIDPDGQFGSRSLSDLRLNYRFKAKRRVTKVKFKAISDIGHVGRRTYRLRGNKRPRPIRIRKPSSLFN